MLDAPLTRRRRAAPVVDTEAEAEGFLTFMSEMGGGTP